MLPAEAYASFTFTLAIVCGTAVTVEFMCGCCVRRCGCTWVVVLFLGWGYSVAIDQERVSGRMEWVTEWGRYRKYYREDNEARIKLWCYAEV